MDKPIIFSDEDIIQRRRQPKTAVARLLSFVSGGYIQTQKQIAMVALVIFCIVAATVYRLQSSSGKDQVTITNTDAYQAHVKTNHPQ